MTPVLDKRSKLLHLVEDPAHGQRQQLACGSVADCANLTQLFEPRDEGRPCHACNRIFQDMVSRWQSACRVAKRRRRTA